MKRLSAKRRAQIEQRFVEWLSRRGPHKCPAFNLIGNDEALAQWVRWAEAHVRAKHLLFDPTKPFKHSTLDGNAAYKVTRKGREHWKPMLVLLELKRTRQ